MFRFHTNRKELDLDLELQRLEVYEADLLQRLESEDGSEVVRIQELLNRIAYETAKIKEFEKDV